MLGWGMSRAKLLSVSARLFAKGGFEATSMRDIAGKAGMLAGSVYYHFPSQNDLIAAGYAAGAAEIGAAGDPPSARPRAPGPRAGGARVAHLAAPPARRRPCPGLTAPL